MGNLIASIRRTGLLIVVGLIVIIYIALGYTYFEQGLQQKNLIAEMEQLRLWLNQPAPQAEKLQAAYDKAKEALAPIALPDVLEIIVNLAGERGINVNPDDGKFRIPPPGAGKMQKIGQGKYHVFYINEIAVECEYDTLMDFIADLDSGKTQENIILQKVNIHSFSTATGEPKEPSDNTTATVNVTATMDVSFYARP